MGGIAKNLERVKQSITDAAKRTGRNPDEVTLIAVSKTKSAEMVNEVIDAGHFEFGENYVQEAREKISEINNDRVQWHFIGHLQTNKVKYIIPHYAMVQTVDRAKLARELAKRAVNAGRTIPVLIEVNISGEQTKSGIDPEGIRELVDTVSGLEGLQLKGLMTMPPFVPAEEARPYFVALRNLRDQLAKSLKSGSSLDDLSMGMSGDFEVAVEEGATIVRVGTSIFGARQ